MGTSSGSLIFANEIRPLAVTTLVFFDAVREAAKSWSFQNSLDKYPANALTSTADGPCQQNAGRPKQGQIATIAPSEGTGKPAAPPWGPPVPTAPSPGPAAYAGAACAARNPGTTPRGGQTVRDGRRWPRPARQRNKAPDSREPAVARRGGHMGWPVPGEREEPLTRADVGLGDASASYEYRVLDSVCQEGFDMFSRGSAAGSSAARRHAASARGRAFISSKSRAA